MKETSVHRRFAAAIGALALMAGLFAAPSAAATTGEPPPEAADGEPLVLERAPVARQLSANNIVRPTFTLVPCLQFTDSIVRLYSAYFQRAPDAGGFEFWRGEFETGRRSLPSMSTFFSQSDEFVERYGSLSDPEFIELIYQNIFGRPADAGGRDFWLGRMSQGLSRGTVMLNFSESPEYIEQSGTLTSPAGHFYWYPDGTEFTCGFDNTEYFIKEGLPYLDVVLVNFNDDPIDVTYEVRQDTTWTVVQQATLNSGGVLQAFGWDLTNNPTMNGLRFTASGEFSWSVAQSPTATPETRGGW